MMSFLFTTIIIVISFGSGLAIGLFYKAEDKKKEVKMSGLPKPK